MPKWKCYWKVSKKNYGTFAIANTVSVACILASEYWLVSNNLSEAKDDTDKAWEIKLFGKKDSSYMVINNWA